MQIALESSEVNKKNHLEEESESEEEALDPNLFAAYDALSNKDLKMYEKLKGSETFELTL